MPELVLEGDWAPAWYRGNSIHSVYHLKPDCDGLYLTRQAGRTPNRSRVGAMKASGRRLCSRCGGAR